MWTDGYRLIPRVLGGFSESVNDVALRKNPLNGLKRLKTAYKANIVIVGSRGGLLFSCLNKLLTLKTEALENIHKYVIFKHF